MTQQRLGNAACHFGDGSGPPGKETPSLGNFRIKLMLLLMMRKPTIMIVITAMKMTKIMIMILIVADNAVDDVDDDKNDGDDEVM